MVNDINRLSLFKEALETCNFMLEKYNNAPVLQSIKNQLKYLIDIETGVETDRSRLSEIIIGRQTAHDIESLDSNAADIFFMVSSEVKKML